MLNIPPLAQENFFWFKFEGQGKRREGTLIPIEETSQPPPKPGHRKRVSINDYRNKKHYEVLQSEAHHLNWCCRCPSQSTFILIYRAQGIFVREKYCDECVQKHIIKL